MESAFLNWSGGKDATMAYFLLSRSAQYQIRYLLTTFNEAYRRVSMHGVRESLLELQARALDLPLKKIWLPEQASMEIYNERMADALKSMAEEDIHTAVFGDIFLEDLRQYREKQLARVGMRAVFPLWQMDSRQLIEQFLQAGFRAIVVCVNAQKLDISFCGRLIDETFLQDLPPDVDPCGENGEYHSFVFDGPLFRFPVLFQKGEVVEKHFSPSSNASSAWDTRYWYCDLIPENKNGA
ncbi:Dph6-related ATP pyrophosphatase [Thermoflavifilum thermophilum]|uniref:MJ0570-related uncharacterized domain-containing protein n=1 Tax=Thermoflavifilum thermophilum TaxID=1393122 RepID=A0A1I7N6A6_9BACT|nr:diphthine--ammonia ligase [Thermoflavifilum thermophilum]SFV30208.1 MJ0570-related uncharacterized domain-containing protein [Thermoflavifilum thermophilum]